MLVADKKKLSSCTLQQEHIYGVVCLSIIAFTLREFRSFKCFIYLWSMCIFLNKVWEKLEYCFRQQGHWIQWSAKCPNPNFRTNWNWPFQIRLKKKITSSLQISKSQIPMSFWKYCHTNIPMWNTMEDHCSFSLLV